MSATLVGLVEQGCEFIVLNCKTLGCKGGGRSVGIGVYVETFGEAATLEQIEQAARCDLCHVKGNCWAEPVIRNPPRMGLGENGWE